MSTKFFTNQGGNSLLKKFDGVFKNVDSIRHFDALVGYFRASGYFKIRGFLDKIPKIRILVGINVDQLIQKYHQKGQYYIDNPEETRQAFLQEMVQNIQEAAYDELTESGIIQFMDDLVNGKIEMRAHPKQKLHAKVYIFRPENFNEYAPCEVITGSSNLTDSGLGSYEESNYEFNVSLRDYEDVKFATDEFERLWNESQPILEADVKELKVNIYLKEYTPFELYIKMLQEYFGKRVEYDPYNIDLLLPNTYKRLKYQSDAANQGYAIMMRHNGFMLADVVGLGKTIIACMVIKKFIYENGSHTKVLIVVPPALEANWRRTTKDFQIESHFEFITLGSLNRITDEEDTIYSNPDQIDLVVVDESHKFRNHTTNMYQGLEVICKRPRQIPAENGDTRKKVILISATPLNNRPQDIENQLYLFQDRRNSTIEGIRNLQDYFKTINEVYKTLTTEDVLNIERLKNLFQKLRDDVIEPLVIRRTRTDLENDKIYMEDLKLQGIKFPKLGDPVPVFYELNEELSKLFFDTVSLITGKDETGMDIEGLGYYRYRAIEYLIKEEDREIYGNVSSISSRLAAIMRTLLVKRLESSFHAFRSSLVRLQRSINNMLAMFEADRIFIAPSLNINKMLEDGYTYEEIEAIINEKESGNNREFKACDFDEDFIKNLQQDKFKIDALVVRWGRVTYDPKLIAFSKMVKKELFNLKNNPSQKLVVFTESKETAEELARKLEEDTDYRIMCISSENRKNAEQRLRENFDANLEVEKWKDDYNIVITTEVLAEGINLHRSNIIINYDVPWNSTRLMQRIGRVNRIGSRANRIFVYNFYPSAQGDTQLRLVNTALRKLQAFHSAFGEDNKIFSLLEELDESEGALFGSKIQKEESETLKYLNELRAFKAKHPIRFAEIMAMPNKVRCGRKAEEERALLLKNALEGDINYPLNQTSIVYLKSDNHPGVFCLVTPELIPIEINFLQAVKIFKATQKEKAIPFHEQHHEQALTGYHYFISEKNQDKIRTVTSKNLSPAENKAIKNLSFVKKVSNASQRKHLQSAIDLVKKGTYVSKSLPKSINDFFSEYKTLLAKDTEGFTDLLFANMLHSLDLTEEITKEVNSTQKPRGIINPKIVLTQSFS